MNTDFEGFLGDLIEDNDQEPPARLGPTAPTGSMPPPDPKHSRASVLSGCWFFMDGDGDIVSDRQSDDAILAYWVEVASARAGGPTSLSRLKKGRDDAVKARHWFRSEAASGPGSWSGSLVLRPDGPGSEVAGYLSLTIEVDRCDEISVEIADRLGLDEDSEIEDLRDKIEAAYCRRNLAGSVTVDMIFVDARHRGMGVGRFLLAAAGSLVEGYADLLHAWVEGGETDMHLDLEFDAEIQEPEAGPMVLELFRRLESELPFVFRNRPRGASALRIECSVGEEAQDF